jgi:hypothetical protein
MYTELVASEQMYHQLFLSVLQELNAPTVEDTLLLHGLGVSAYSTIEKENNDH